MASTSIAFRAFFAAGLLVLSSGCYVRLDTRVGHRTYPNPDHDALEDVREGPTAPLPRLAQAASVAVCRPEMEAPGPGGLRTQDGDVSGFLPQDAPEAKEQVVHEALVAGLLEAGVTVESLASYCELGATDSGTAPFFLRSHIIRVEHDVHELSDAVGEHVMALALEVSLYRRDGALVFHGLYAGAARAGLREATPPALAHVSVRRVLSDLLGGRFGRLLEGA